MTRAASPPAPGGPDPLRLSRDGLCSLIPHGAGMCLLQRVEAFAEDSIRCSTDTHLDPGNPLRANEGLAAIHGLEYGAQAMAVHGALLSAQGPAPAHQGYIAAVHELRLLVPRLDTERERLLVEARRLLLMQGSLVYQVGVEAGGTPLVNARITVMQRSGSPV